MDERTAKKATAEWRDALQTTEVWPWEASRIQAAASAGWEAIFGVLRWTVPEPETWLVTHRGEDAPAVYVLAGRELYEVECEEISASLHARARAKKVHLDPAETQVDMTTAVSDPFGYTRMEIDWSFGLRPDWDLTIRTIFDREEPTQKRDHVFAVALARVLGWDFPLTAPAADS